jgi:hypothetical protein
MSYSGSADAHGLANGAIFACVWWAKCACMQSGDDSFDISQS